MVSFSDVTVANIPTIQLIAEITWWQTYGSIISKEQIEFMLDYIYSEKALEKVISEGAQQFILLQENESPKGFAAFGSKANQPGIYKLHKLYVLPESHGKGYGRMLIDEVIRVVRPLGATELDLNVNRSNPAKKFYENYGFRVIKEEDVPIGPYFMNDFVMKLIL